MNAPHTLAGLQAQWDLEPAPPSPPPTALLAPRVARVLPYVLLLGFTALYLALVLLAAALRCWE